VSLRPSSAMRDVFSLARLGYFRNGWGIFHSGKSYPPVETLNCIVFALIGLEFAARNHSDSY
jgi:hypothetical protein